MVEWSKAPDIRLSDCTAVYQWCEFKSRRGKNKNLTAQRSNSNTDWFLFQTYIYNVRLLYKQLMINILEFCSAMSQKQQYTCRSKKNIIVSDHTISHELKLFHNYCICHPVLFILCNVYKRLSINRDYQRYLYIS